MSSIKDVARKAGVSISTVSNVLNKTKYVSDELKKKVEVAVQELGYEADPFARNMKTKQSRMIGVITADLCGLFYPYVLKGIYEIANQEGYSVVVYDTSSTYEKFSSLEKEKEYFKSLASSKVDGIIFCSVIPRSMEPTYIDEIKKIVLSKKDIAMVSLERDFSAYGIDSVFSDSYEGSLQAVRYLLSLGCRKIGHITGPVYSALAQDRIDGYKSAMKESGVEVREETMLAHGDFSHQSGYTCMRSLLESMPELDGVYVANDQMAVGASMYLKERGRRIPEDVKIMGYDDVFVSSIVEPSISTIHVSKKKMGLEAAKALISQIYHREEKREALRIELETKLVIRQTTQKDICSDWILSDW